MVLQELRYAQEMEKVNGLYYFLYILDTFSNSTG